MSFSSSVKKELANILYKDHEILLAELAALTRMCCSLRFVDDFKLELAYTLENPTVISKLFKIVKSLYGYNAQLVVVKSSQLRKRSQYQLNITDKHIAQEILYDTAFVDNGNFFQLQYDIPEYIIPSEDSRRAYLRGSFMGGGTILQPEKQYHLEFVTKRLSHAENLSELLAKDHINGKIFTRKDQFILYLKDSDMISLTLNIMGAHQSLLKLEDVKAFKNMKNNINRQVNCETANLSKTVAASMEQRAAIIKIKENDGWENLPEDLKMLCQLRMDNPDESLSALGKQMSPPISKSGVNYRMKKIIQMAKDMK